MKENANKCKILTENVGNIQLDGESLWRKSIVLSFWAPKFPILQMMLKEELLLQPLPLGI